jgi:predicted  nucleic acid-binding Zn-ribbon protein
VKRALIDVLREEDGVNLRQILDRLSEKTDPEARALYERIIRNPELRDLIAH